MRLLETTATADWLARYNASVAAVLPTSFDLVAARGEGSWITDVEGRRYLDFGSGIAVTNVGHCHPRVVAAVAEQAATLLHTSVVFRHAGYIELAERLGRLAPFLADPQVFLCNSGAEAVDGSLKLARHVTGRGAVVAFRGAFHGRTLASTSLTTAKDRYREGYEPLLPGVHVAPYCIPVPGRPQDEVVAEALTGLDEVLSRQSPGPGVGAMIVEPVLVAPAGE